MVEMEEAVTVAHGEVILVAPVEVVPVVQVDAVIPDVLPLVVTVEGVRIVRVVRVHHAVDLQPCLRKK